MKSDADESAVADMVIELAAAITAGALDHASTVEWREELRELLRVHDVRGIAAVAGWTVMAEELARGGYLEAAVEAVRRAHPWAATDTDEACAVATAFVMGVREVSGAFERVGRIGETEEISALAVKVAGRLWEEDPTRHGQTYGAALSADARLMAWLGDMGRAVSSNAIAIELLRRSSDPVELGALLEKQSLWLHRLGRHPEAALLHPELAAFVPDPEDRWELGLADQLAALCLTLVSTGQGQHAEERLDGAIKSMRNRAKTEPVHLATLARLEAARGLIRSGLKRHAPAAQAGGASVELLRDLALREPRRHQAQLASALGVQSSILMAGGQVDTAIQAARDAANVLGKIQSAFPDQYAAAYVAALTRLSEIECTKHPQAAVQDALVAEDVCEACPVPEDLDHVRRLNAQAMGRALAASGQAAEAVLAFDLADSLAPPPGVRLPAAAAARSS